MQLSLLVTGLSTVILVVWAVRKWAFRGELLHPSLIYTVLLGGQFAIYAFGPYLYNLVVDPGYYFAYVLILLCFILGVDLGSRRGLHIGKRVNISPWVQIYTASHDLQSSEFAQKLGAVHIRDYCWISTRSTILPGVTIGEGSVVAAGAVVSKDVPPYTVVAGVPAKSVGERNRNLNYVPIWDTWFQ